MTLTGRKLVFEGATVLSGPSWEPLPDSAILIEGDRIAMMMPSDSLPIPPDARVVDCKGKFILPGFIDMHTHCHTIAAIDFLSQFGPVLHDSAHKDWFLKMFLAYGVTCVRDVGNFSEIFDLKKEFSNSTAAPKMSVAGELLEGAEPLWPLGRKVTDDETARREVKRQKKLGADWIKLYVGLNPSQSEAVINEAHVQGMQVAGHIGLTCAREAARMGIDTLEHAMTLIDPGFLSEKDRAEFEKSVKRNIKRDHYLWMWKRADMNGEAAIDLMQVLKESRAAVCPTLIVHENTLKGPNRSYTNFAYDFVPQQWLEIWEGRFKIFNPKGKAPAENAKVYDDAAKLIHELHSAGTKIIGGTDAALWNPYVVPGASIHREMELLVDAGLDNDDVLSSVTWNAAKVLGLNRELGSIEAGKLANLVVLNANPLKKIKETRDIALVVNKGYTFTPEDIMESTDLIS